MILTCKKIPLSFIKVDMNLHERNITDIFVKKNNKTLAQTLVHHRYSKLTEDISSTYSSYMDWKLGDFLKDLKTKGDIFYLKFLNNHGDKQYCTFKVSFGKYRDNKGLYTFSVAGKLKYVGLTTDSYNKRINHGYGRITPKNCFKDGRSTNCHLNSLINGENSVEFHFFPMKNDNEIRSYESELIKTYSPPWNIKTS